MKYFLIAASVAALSTVYSPNTKAADNYCAAAKDIKMEYTERALEGNFHEDPTNHGSEQWLNARHIYLLNLCISK
jgi:hypothetical protein